jgi:CheY-like chemotaxis protein
METRDAAAWLVDDDPEDAALYARLLEQAGLPRVEVFLPEPLLAGTVAMASDPAAGAVLIDHDVRDRAGVLVGGLAVADYLRGVRPELPIFLLVDHAAESDPEPNAGAVESVIPKPHLHGHAPVYAARILRAMARYDAALSARQRRIRELVDRKVSADSGAGAESFGAAAEAFGEAEERELASLRAETERAFDLALSGQDTARDEQLRREEERLAELRAIAAELAQLNAGPRAPQ